MSKRSFLPPAPRYYITNVKGITLAGPYATDISALIDWRIYSRERPGLEIRVVTR